MLQMKSIPLSLGLLSLCLLLHSANCVTGPFLGHRCFSQATYIARSPYASNLNELFHFLSTSLVPPTGFGKGSVGQGQSQVNGLALCQGDVSTANCKSCVTEASKELHRHCPNRKGAIIWFDYCLVKYSNVNFFGNIDKANKFHLFNVKGVSNPVAFNKKVNELLSILSNVASGSTRKLYATGELKIGVSTTLYGLAQCIRDISRVECNRCLDIAISELPKCCSGKRGARTVGGSCSVRYELYPFVGT
ncbi:Cysteine-rich repeat secretory protein [Quillaja saponaria]|uniref:Cysteine-rich repeat secretory protein n=1 Tax=Quillaja saponaria TaxID=32244 RepID=A0AAD7PAZ0_QUISA|nr:Cysteine-rich repeat secretory protein [Quillaja saponaria]